MVEPRWEPQFWRKEHDTDWADGCRRLQCWWREVVLREPPGPLHVDQPQRLVASMLPATALQTGGNFLDDRCRAAADARVHNGDHSGIVNVDRLYRNLLSSQPLCFNLFGPFWREPQRLLPWLKAVDGDAREVLEIRFEWAPPPKKHFRGGSAFDVCIAYRTVDGPRFLGVECKYAEDLSKSTIKVRQPYIDFTNRSGLWREGAAERLDRPALCASSG